MSITHISGTWRAEFKGHGARHRAGILVLLLLDLIIIILSLL